LQLCGSYFGKADAAAATAAAYNATADRSAILVARFVLGTRARVRTDMPMRLAQNWSAAIQIWNLNRVFRFWEENGN
jgi:hypothetical protein